jgi:hypothetical protein
MRNHSPHTHDGAGSDDQGRSRNTLAQHAARTQVGMVLNPDVAVTLRSGRKGHEITYDAVVLDIRVKIGMEVAPNSNVGRNGDEGRQDRALSQLNIIEYYHIRRADRKAGDAVLRAALGQALTDAAIRDGNANGTRSARSSTELSISENTPPVGFRRLRSIIDEHQLESGRTMSRRQHLIRNRQRTSTAAARTVYSK